MPWPLRWQPGSPGTPARHGPAEVPARRRGASRPLAGGAEGFRAPAERLHKYVL